MSAAACGTPVPTATLYETRTTVLPTRSLSVDSEASTTATITASYTSTLSLPTGTLYSTPACQSDAATSQQQQQQSQPQQSTSSTGRSSTQQRATSTSALATVSDAAGKASVVYVTYTYTPSSLPPVIVTVGPTGAAPTSSQNIAAVDANSTGHSSSHTGAIAGGVVGAVAALAIIATAILFCLRRKRNARQSEALDDLFQRSTGATGHLAVMPEKPSRGNSHHSTLSKGYAGDESHKHDVALPTLLARSKSDVMTTSTPLHADAAHYPDSAAADTPPALNRSASDNWRASAHHHHRLSNPNFLAAMEVNHSGSGHNSSGTATTPTGAAEGAHTPDAPPSDMHNSLLGARPMSMTEIRSTPSSPTYPCVAPLSHGQHPQHQHQQQYRQHRSQAASWYGIPAQQQMHFGLPQRSMSPPAMLQHHHHHHQSQQHNGLPSPPTSPTWHNVSLHQPRRTMSPPPVTSAQQQQQRKPPTRHRTLSSGSLSTLLTRHAADANKPATTTSSSYDALSTLAQQSFGVQQQQQKQEHSPSQAYSSSSLPNRRSTTSPPPVRSDWPPSRYGHLDIGAQRRLSAQVEETLSQSPSLQDGTLEQYHRSLAKTHRASIASLDGNGNSGGSASSDLFWRSNVHAPMATQAPVSKTTVAEDDGQQQEEAERRLRGSNNLFVLNADAKEDDEDDEDDE